MKKYTVILFLSILSISCTTTQKGTGIGAVSGAAIGGIIGHQSGNAGTGAAVGGAIGALGGYAVGENMKSKFCPVGGEQFDESVQFCPTHGVELKQIEE